MTEYKDYLVSSGDSLCVGLDPHMKHMSPYLMQEIKKHGMEHFLWLWCSAIVNASNGSVFIYKIQSSFFEAYGDLGFRVMKKVTDLIKSLNSFVILDAKRCDISSTMTAYGEMAFEWLGADAMTVVPYMGSDSYVGLSSWLNDKFLYVVSLTSNPSWEDFQKLEYRDNKKSSMVANVVMDKTRQWFRNNSFQDSYGFVVGATHYNFYSSHSADPLLLPGMGFQGGSEDPEHLSNLQKQNPLSVFPLSRGITALPNVMNWKDFEAGISKNSLHFRGLLQSSSVAN